MSTPTNEQREQALRERLECGDQIFSADEVRSLLSRIEELAKDNAIIP